MATEVKRIAAKYGQHYETGPLLHQFSTVVRRIFRHALPSKPASTDAQQPVEPTSPRAEPAALRAA